MVINRCMPVTLLTAEFAIGVAPPSSHVKHPLDGHRDSNGCRIVSPKYMAIY
jgi:hypothetical protein